MGEFVECGDLSPLSEPCGDESPHSTFGGLNDDQGRSVDVIVLKNIRFGFFLC